MEGEGLSGFVAGTVAGGNCHGVVAVILLDAEREFAVAGNYCQTAIN